MDVRLSSEQRALQDSAAQLVRRFRPHAVVDLDDHERVAKLDAALAASGWRDLRSAGDDGKPWASAVEAGVVANELASGLADVAFIGPALAADLRRLGGSPAATSAETVTFAADLSAPATAAGGAMAPGAVAFDAAGATAAVVLNREGGGYSLATVPVELTPGGVDLTRSTAAPTPGREVTLLAGQPISPEDLRRWTALGLAIACADLVGTMRGAIELAREHACVRRQFGVAVGSFQAVQHLLADAYVAMEGAHSIALHAAWAVDALEPGEALAAAAAAKAYCARAARDVCEIGIQVHGGIGNTWDCLAHVYLRRAIASCDLLGGVGPSLVRVLDHHGVRSGDGFR
jgi:alkylation response protein AidB-like acyl-CoA dehydrogenase